jgi:hypothetical protein
VDEIEPRRAINGEEVDAYSRYARRWYHWRPGERAAIKARTHRRERQQRKRATDRTLREEIA